jgi:hypothetical protein
LIVAIQKHLHRRLGATDTLACLSNPQERTAIIAAAAFAYGKHAPLAVTWSVPGGQAPPCTPALETIKPAKSRPT